MRLFDGELLFSFNMHKCCDSSSDCNVFLVLSDNCPALSVQSSAVLSSTPTRDASMSHTNLGSSNPSLPTGLHWKQKTKRAKRTPLQHHRTGQSRSDTGLSVACISVIRSHRIVLSQGHAFCQVDGRSEGTDWMRHYVMPPIYQSTGW